MGRLVYQHGTSSKFWEGTTDGAVLRVRFGRIGTDGQDKVKQLTSPAAARAALAKLVAEKLGKGYVAGTGKARPAQARRSKPPATVKSNDQARSPATISPAVRAAIVELARRLGGAALVQEVELAVSDPPAYLKKFRARMDAINVDRPRADLPWLALIEGLSARRKVVELDWKHEADDALHWVQRLAGAAGKRALAVIAKDPDLPERRTDEGLEQAGGALAAAKLALIHLDKLSDSYAVAVVPAADVAALAALARRGGAAIRHFTGAKFRALEQQRLRAQRAEQARQSSANRWTRLRELNWQKSTDGVLWSLRHHPYPVEEVRQASADAPARDRPLIAMTLALHDQPPTKVARATRDPALCLHALRYWGQERVAPAERVNAAAILVERLRIPPGSGKPQQHVMLACNLFADDEAVDRAVVKMPAVGRARLARLADAYLKGSWHQSARWNDAYRALRSIGDQTSIAAIEASRARLWPQFKGHVIKEIEDALVRIERRAAMGAGA